MNGSVERRIRSFVFSNFEISKKNLKNLLIFQKRCDILYAFGGQANEKVR